jgi:Putative Flp pilus-assembly TadE/G-like
MTNKLRSVFGVFSQRLVSDTRGVTLALVALALSALIGFTGLGVETGLWYSIKRYNQSAADIGALSGAMELAAVQPYSDICKLAERAAQANGFAFVSFTCPTSSPACTSPATGQMCANNPPVLGAYAGQTTAVEVILAQRQNAFFASLFLPNVTIRTRAVAGLKSFPTCMLALNTTGQDLTNSGNATLTLNQCSFMSNSADSQSIRFNGGVTVQAAAIDTNGQYKISGNSNSVSPPITTGVATVADPYSGKITYILPSGTPTCPPSTGSAVPLQPGLYGCSGGGNPAPMNFSSGTTTLCPGVYYLDGEDNQGEALVISGNGTIVNMGIQGVNGCPTNGMNGVTIIATCSSPSNCKKGGGFIIGGTGSNTPTVTLSAPTNAVPSGCTQPSTACIPPNVLFYQDPVHANINKGTSTLAGGQSVSLIGVVYTPATQIGLDGNPKFNSCTELIAASFNIAGTPTMNAPTCGINTASVTTLVLLE